MKYNITELDKETLLECTQYKYRLYITDSKKNILDMVEGVQSIGSYGINADSNPRRTSSFTLKLDYWYEDIEQKIANWLGLNFKLEIGMYNTRNADYLWYECGYYLITEANTIYSSTENSLTLNVSDWWSRLDGTRNGQVGGAPTITIPTIDGLGNEVTLKDSMSTVITAQTDLKDIILSDVGEYKGMPENNSDYLAYRTLNPDWNKLPYDLEFNGGCTVSSMVEEIRDLYTNNQAYFDATGNFCFDMIPSCDNNPIVLDNDYLQSILIGTGAESVTYDVSNIKNVTEVFGRTYDIDRLSTSCTSAATLYTITLSDYDSYKSYDYISFTANSNNIAEMKIRVNSLDIMPIYYEGTTTYLDPDVILANEMYVVQLKKVNNVFVAYFLGQFQPHAVCVLTNNENDTTFTKDYFKAKYNCDNIVFRVEDSQFAVQKFTENLDYKSGDEFDNIESDSVAIENAIYYNKKSSSWSDTVTLTTKLIPFLDVHQKVSYKKQQESEIHQYIVKSIQHNLSGMTSSITLYRFYPLYYA